MQTPSPRTPKHPHRGYPNTSQMTPKQNLYGSDSPGVFSGLGGLEVGEGPRGQAPARPLPSEGSSSVSTPARSPAGCCCRQPVSDCSMQTPQCQRPAGTCILAMVGSPGVPPGSFIATENQKRKTVAFSSGGGMAS